MSDETPPPPLRLKPRQRSESETPAEEAPADSAGADEGKLRLKPKLAEAVEETAPAAEPEPEVAEPEVAEPPEIEPVRSKPKLTLEPEPEPEPVAEEPPAEVAPESESTPPPMPLPEEGKIKLKIKLPGGAAQEATIPPAEEPPSLPPFPVVAPPPPEGEEMDAPPLLSPAGAARTPAPFAATLPPGGSRPAVFKRPRIPAAILAAERRKRMLKYASIAVGGIVLAGVIIFGAYLKFTEPPKVVIPPRPKFVPPPPVAVVAPPAPKPAPIVEPPTVEPGAGTRVATTATIELAPGITATTESIRAVPNASSQFKQFVASAKVSGVYQGNPPRAFINGRLVHTGEMIDDVQEIYFDSIDVATRSLVFKDGRGATVSRRY